MTREKGTAMIEPTPTLTEVLVRGGIYSHYGIVYIAIDDDTLEDLTSTHTITARPHEALLVEEPGTPAWDDRMIRARDSLNRALKNSQDNLERSRGHLDRLGEAILEEAKSRDWCEEYDTFAERWDLPRRVKEFDVTVSVRVEARNEDHAREIVENGVSLDSYNTDGVIGQAEYRIDETY